MNELQLSDLGTREQALISQSAFSCWACCGGCSRFIRWVASRTCRQPRHACRCIWIAYRVLRRSMPPPGMLKHSPVSYIGGYVFHIGLAIIVFLFAPHILLISGSTGLSWPGLPSQFVDLAAVVTMSAMVVVLVRSHQQAGQALSQHLRGLVHLGG